MTAFKRFVSPSALITSCVVALWGLYVASAVLLYPIASQTTENYRLGKFSQYALAFIHDLQLERAISTGFIATGDAKPFNKRLRPQYKKTDKVRKRFEKMWSRFNSSDFRPEFTSTMKSAELRLAELGQKRSDVLADKMDTGATFEFYTDLIAKLSTAIFHMETLKLESASAATSRSAYMSITRASELAAREMTIGLVLVAGGVPSKQQQAQWRTLVSEQDALLSLYKTYLDLPALTKIKAWGKSRVKVDADNMRDQLRVAIDSGQPIDTLSMADWFETFAQKQKSLSQFAMFQHQDFMKKTGSVAARSAYFFVSSLFITLIVTFGVMTWRRPDALRQSLLICIVVFNLALTLWALTAGPDWLAFENGPIEILQIVVVAFAFVLFSLAAAKEYGAARTGAVALACVCFFILLREADFRNVNAPEWLISITTGGGRRLLAWLTGLLTLIYVLSRSRHLQSLFRSSLAWKAWPIYLWFPLLIAGELIEIWTKQTRKDDVQGYWANGQFWEELLELDAYVMLLYAAYIFREIYRSCPRGSDSQAIRLH